MRRLQSLIQSCFFLCFFSEEISEPFDVQSIRRLESIMLRSSYDVDVALLAGSNRFNMKSLFYCWAPTLSKLLSYTLFMRREVNSFWFLRCEQTNWETFLFCFINENFISKFLGQLEVNCKRFSTMKFHCPSRWHELALKKFSRHLNICTDETWLISIWNRKTFCSTRAT